MRRTWLISLLLAPAVAVAEPSRTVTHARILAGDIAAGLGEVGAQVDLGPAPPPGGSRLVSGEEVERGLRAAGISPRRGSIPRVTRVTRASRRLEPAQIAELSRPAIERELRPGVRLVRVEATTPLVMPPDVSVRTASVPRPPRQQGSARLGTTVELVSGDEVVARVPVVALVDVDASAARPDVARGATLSLTVNRSAVRVSAAGLALRDGDVGEVVPFEVPATGRVVRAKIASPAAAEVVEAP